MVEKLCKNCVYWNRDEHDFNKNFGKCKCDKFVYTGKSEFEDVETNSDGLNYWDSEGYMARFETGENFGCVHFKERE